MYMCSSSSFFFIILKINAFILRVMPSKSNVDCTEMC